MTSREKFEAWYIADLVGWSNEFEWAWAAWQAALGSLDVGAAARQLSIEHTALVWDVCSEASRNDLRREARAILAAARGDDE